MAKILSQNEIDALLTTVSTSEAEVEDHNFDDEQMRSVIAYDFKHPNRVSKDQIRTLENLHDNFAGHYGSTLSTVLRTARKPTGLPSNRPTNIRSPRVFWM